ncbi:MAG TPA: 3-beta hydroxysteroid dehydrogenase [Alphaproteobacteria bacterium]|nr:3-beta hydroxysteroid dehydrogenase [Alphaproteobacteria bacterium]HAJ47572.1 3-beta hydroxysteroid dehydrogenase [Alphaproteobacteria bacterium]
MKGRVEGKIALVTGGAQGLGRAIALKLAEHGAKIAVSDINKGGADETASLINTQYPNKAAAWRHDVTSEQDWQSVLAAVSGHYGGLHVLVNNAGIGGGSTVTETPYELFKKVQTVDVDSVFLGCKYAIPLMAKTVKDTNLGGSIVNISSIAGIIAAANQVSYNAAKAAVLHLSKSVALHCAKQQTGIRCNSVHPVFIKTPILDPLVERFGAEEAYAKLGRQIPLGHIGEPDDIAYAVLYLASDESKMVTGAELKVDGGISAM